MYFSPNSQPDIVYPTHCCARFGYCPKASHRKVILHIIKKDNQGSRTNHDSTQTTEPHSLHWHWLCKTLFYEDKSDPLCMKSRTGLAIMFVNYPIMWVSKLYDWEITSLSTTESKTIALTQLSQSFLQLKNKLIHVMKHFRIHNSQLNISE